MAASLKPLSYISAPMLSEERSFEVKFFQVLRIEPKIIEPFTFEEEKVEAGLVLFQVAVQHLERWAPMSHNLCEYIELVSREFSVAYLRRCEHRVCG